MLFFFTFSGTLYNSEYHIYIVSSIYSFIFMISPDNSLKIFFEAFYTNITQFVYSDMLFQTVADGVMPYFFILDRNVTTR